MRYIDRYKGDIIQLLFVPSGQLLVITRKDFETLSDFVLMDYNKEFDAYVIDDNNRQIAVMVLKDKKYEM